MAAAFSGALVGLKLPSAYRLGSVGWSSLRVGAAATSVKSSAGQLYGYYIYNSNASAVYVQIFNTASGSVTLGTTAPVLSLGIPTGSAANVSIVGGLAFGTAISWACTTTRAGSSAPSNTCDANFFYK